MGPFLTATVGVISSSESDAADTVTTLQQVIANSLLIVLGKIVIVSRRFTFALPSPVQLADDPCSEHRRDRLILMKAPAHINRLFHQ